MEDRKKILGANIFWIVLIFMNLGSSLIIGQVTNDSTISIIASQLSIILTMVVYLLVTKQNPLKLLRFKTFHFGSFFLVILLAVCVIPITSMINAISMLFASNAVVGTLTDITGGGLLPALLIMAVLPAFVEECTFRGVIMGSYATGGRPVKAIVFSAIVFGLMHMNFNQMCYAIFMGLVFGAVVEATGSIFSSMTMHFCINGFSTLVTWAMPRLTEYLKQMVPPEEAAAVADSLEASNEALTTEALLNTIFSILPVALIAAVLAWLLLKAIAKLNGNEDKWKLWLKKDYKEDREAVPKVRIFDIPYGIAAVLCLIMCVLTELASKMMGM